MCKISLYYFRPVESTANMNHFDTALAGRLGFIYFGIGGSRNFRDGDFAVPGQKSGESQDWDLIGIVDSKEDIVSLALHRESQVLYLLGIMQAEYSPWSVSSLIIRVKMLTANLDNRFQKTMGAKFTGTYYGSRVSAKMVRNGR